MKYLIDSLPKKKHFTLKSEGESMLPLLQPKDILYFKKISFQKVKVNDLIMVKKRRNLLSHKVIYKTEKYLITKGDNNIDSDGKIFPNQIIARVEKVKRNNQVFYPENTYLFQPTQYFQEIVKIKKALEKEKINFVFLKGLPLHLYFEKSHPKRTYADCDILVDKKNWQRTSLILKEYGFSKVKTAYTNFHRILKDKETELVYYKKINNFPVVFDIHFEVNFMMNQLGRLDALYPQVLIDQMTKQFLKEKKLVKIQDECFSILSPTNLIIYLSLHFFHHNFRGMFRLEFLDKIIRKSPSEVYLSLTDKINKYQLQNFIYPVFLLLEKYYSTSLPCRFLPSIKPEKKYLNYINKELRNINIFNDEMRIQAGINRFRNLFFLSPNPLWKRLLIVFNIQVIYSVIWVMIFLARRSLVKVFKSSKAIFS